jgi:hypothetical protein
MRSIILADLSTSDGVDRSAPYVRRETRVKRAFRYLGEYRMRLFVLLLPLAVSGCLSFSSSNPPPPAPKTVVLPPGTTIVCSNGSPPPCQ